MGLGNTGATERIVNSKDLQQQSKAFDELSDSVEDRLLDSSRVQEAMASIAASAEADGNVMRMREIIGCSNELELDKKVAERTLREHKGDAVAAIQHLLRLNTIVMNQTL
ncbi:hypothetical protein MANES_03G205301v8 [Manihot esculenta]|uniref:Uncharacterized protein n=1 Tax=Manihot esculenta TaxID=3983 RepID=A0ACB7I1Y3_MANES|nr:hypothetical protein MANES_03G205301v8 [Manihot esculenta]